MIKYTEFAVTTSAAGAGTVTAGPVNGLIYEVRCPGTAFSSTADFTLTRAAVFGGTVLVATDAQVPWSYFPRSLAATAVNGGAISGSWAPVPSDGQLTLTVAQAGSVTSGTVYVIYDDLT